MSIYTRNRSQDRVTTEWDGRVLAIVDGNSIAICYGDDGRFRRVRYSRHAGQWAVVDASNELRELYEQEQEREQEILDFAQDAKALALVRSGDTVRISRGRQHRGQEGAQVLERSRGPHGEYLRVCLPCGWTGNIGLGNVDKFHTDHGWLPCGSKMTDAEAYALGSSAYSDKMARLGRRVQLDNDILTIGNEAFSDKAQAIDALGDHIAELGSDHPLFLDLLATLAQVTKWQ